MTTPPKPPAAPARLHPTAVLLVEPHPVLRDRLTSMLLECPSRPAVTAVARLPEALALARGTRFDAILVELDLQGPDGLDALRVLRGMAPAATLIALTGPHEVALDALSTELGADLCIHTLTEFERIGDVVTSLPERGGGERSHA